MKINITNLDGKSKEYLLEEINGQQLVEQFVSKQEAENIVAYVLNGTLKDLYWTIATDAEVSFVKKDSSLGWKVLNYGCAMVVAHVIKLLYPAAKIALGQTFDDGFYVDFDYKRQLNENDLAIIAKKMREVLKQKISITRVCHTKEQSLAAHKGNEYAEEYIKLKHIDGLKCSYLIDNKTLVVASNVAINSSKDIKNFKLLSITGAYWLGDDNNKQLQRITGICDYSKELLEKHLAEFSERKLRDHRVIGKALNIFTFDDDCGKGLPIFLPNGMIIKKVLQAYLRAQEFKWEYQEVSTPVLGSVALYKKSGHWDHYRENMFTPIVKNDEQLVLRPMTCPHHCMIYTNIPRSYRDLPLRLSEHALLYRYETSGALTGLERVRSMELTDSHIFVTVEQIKDEFKRCYQLIAEVLKTLNIKIDYLSLSLRDSTDKEKYFNDDKMWNQAELSLREVLDELKLDYQEMIGEAAFYGPKLDVQIKTALGHEVTISTIQFDFLLPQKFNLTYKNHNNKDEHPVIIHRGLIGTYERFIATLLEQTKGIFPLWLAPEQIWILPINETQPILEYANQIYQELKINNIRSKISSNGTISKRIAETYAQKVVYQIVIGQKELENKTLSYKKHGTQENVIIKVDKFLELINKEIANKN